MRRSLLRLASVLPLLLPVRSLPAQTPPTAAAITSQGLRLSANKGSFRAAQYAPDGSLILLYDQGDGLRVLKTDATATTITAEAQAGAAGDTGLTLALDASGNVYVAGTSTSGALSGTPGAAFPSPADSSTNSFIARFDSGLHLLFLSFLGSGRTAVSGVAATPDAVFVTGATYGTSLPVTASAVQPTPASGSTGNGFVERFSPDGASLVYATYLTGPGGNTSPAAIAADTADNAYVTGQTAAPGFPTVNALQPQILGATSGFLTKLTPAGDAFVFSTFLAGSGLTGLALDPGSNTLLLTGNVTLGQFPVATVAAPIANTPYQSLLRLSRDGQSVPESVLLVPGTQSSVTPGPNGTAWVSSSLTTPLFPITTAVQGTAGDSVLLHVTAAGAIDQALRLGGLPVANASYATLTSSTGAPALSPDAATLVIPSTLTATATASLAPAQRFDLPLAGAPTQALPNTPADLLPAACDGLSQCTGTGGLLSLVNTTATGASLSLSTGDLPSLILRNTGPATATDLTVQANGFALAGTCGATLQPDTQCSLALSGAGPGSLSVSAANAPSVTANLPASTTSPDALVLNTSALDFGLVTADASPALQTITVTNLTAAPQTFSSALDAGPQNPPYTLSEAASTCAGTPTAHTVAANASCTITLGLSAATASLGDGPVHAFWKLGPRDLAITGSTQAAALAVSAAEIDFGTQIASSTARLPRYLYLSNPSGSFIAHTPVTLLASSPFAVLDGCPTLLEPGSVCQITLTYHQTTAPATDSTTLLLDEGLSVLVTGGTFSAAPASGTAVPSLTVSPATVAFPTPVPLTTLSADSQSVTVTNTGSTTLPLTASVTGDFSLSGSCAATLNPGASCIFVLQFAPSQPGVREGLLSLNAGSAFTPVTVALTGTGAPLLPADNGSLDLGETPLSEPAVSWFKVQAPLPSLTAAVTGSAFGVALVEDQGSGHSTLPASAFTAKATSTCNDCWLGIHFLPATAGPSTSSLTLSSTPGGNPYLLALTATGVPWQGLVLTPGSQDLGSVPVGSTSAPLTFTLANLLTPAAAVVLQNVSVTGDFQIAPNNTGGASCSGALAPTASCFLQVTFTPTGTGARSGTLTVATSAGTVTASLSGSGPQSSVLALKPTSLDFQIEPGTPATQQSVTLTNTGSATLLLGAPNSSVGSFTAITTCSTLAPASSCTVTVSLDPGTSVLDGILTIPVSSASTGEPLPKLTIPLVAGYTNAQSGLLLLPNDVTFGPQAVGSQGQTRLFTLTNTSADTATVALTLPRQFPLAAPFACTTLAAGASCSFSVTFLPETAGPITGSITATATFASDNTAQAIAYLRAYGTGSGALSVVTGSPGGAPVNFGQVTSGASAQQSFTLTNTGTGALNLRRVVSSPPFFATSTCGQALAPGASCTVELSYAPVYPAPSSGASSPPRSDTGKLMIESDAAASPDAITLTGTAVPSSTTGAGPLQTYTLSNGALTFANTQAGQTSSPQSLTLTNTGNVPLTISAVFAPVDFAVNSACPALQPRTSCSLAVTFTPGAKNAAAVRSGALEIQSKATNALEFVSLLGMSVPAPLTLSPTALDFGAVALGAHAQLSLTTTNTAALPITFGQLSATGDFTVALGSCPAAGSVLPTGASCTLLLTFAPIASGMRTGTLTVPTDASATAFAVPLTGTGQAAKLQVTPGTLRFSDVDLGRSATLPINLANLGPAVLNGLALSVTGPDAADFALTLPCPTTALAANAACVSQITFTPSAAGARNANLTVSSSDPSGPATIPLSGIGTQPPSFTLTVNGASAASLSVAAGSPASFALMVTPLHDFTGAVTLTCAPLSAAPYATCTLPNSQLDLTGGPQPATATITTITAVTTTGSGLPWPFLLLPAVPFAGLQRRRASNAKALLGMLLLLLSLEFCLTSIGCGGPGSSTGQHLTPAGSYQYRVTATSASGAPLSSAVTLTLVVQ